MKAFYLACSILFIIACGRQNSIDSFNGDWLIPPGEVFDGGPGKDGIPSVDNPSFIDAADVTFLDDNDLVIGVYHNGKAKAIAHRILDWHEIVNDNIDDMDYALVYCPLTGTGSSWNRNVNNSVTTFGVSGLLYNTNIIPYDRGSDSNWSQIRLDAVNGDLIGERVETFPVLETTWATWKKYNPDSQVMTFNTGFSRNYSQYPYGDYRTNNSRIIFPVSNTDSRLPAKERVLALLDESLQRVYSIELFQEDRVISDTYLGEDILVFGSKNENYITAYYNQNLVNPVPSDEDGIMAIDDNGNKISILGEIVEGPLNGTQLTQVNSMIAYFFSIGAFYPDVEIYN